MRNRFPVLLLSFVLLVTVAASLFLVYANTVNPGITSRPQNVSVQEDASSDAETAASDEASLVADTGTSADATVYASVPDVVAARSSTATAVVGQLPRELPVDEGSEGATNDATEAVTLVDLDALRAEREAQAGAQAHHFTSVSAVPPDSGITYDDIWRQFETQGSTYRYDAAYDLVEQDANSLVDAVFVEMTRLQAGSGDAEALAGYIADLETVDVSAFSTSEKLVIKRSSYFLDWQNVCVASYAEQFLNAYDRQDTATMNTMMQSVRNVYAEMAYETDVRYQVVNAY